MAGWVASERGTSVLSLEGSEALEFVLAHPDRAALAEAYVPGSTADEADTVRVQGLMKRGSARLGALEGLAAIVMDAAITTLTEPLNDGSLHAKLDVVERHEPDEVPNPDNTNPATGDTLNIGEVPVTVSSNDGGDELSDAERNHQGNGRALHEEEAVGTGDEDKGLGNDGDLEVQDHVNVVVVDVVVVTFNTELVLKEGGVPDDHEQGDSGKREPDTVGNGE